MGLTGRQLQSIITIHRTKTRTERTQWDRWRSWYLSEYWNSGNDLPSGAGDISSREEQINIETNYPYAYVDTMIANICPTNPQVTVMARQDELRESARFREALINDSFKRNSLHRLLWKTATNAAICGRGFLKTLWNFNTSSVEYTVVDPRYVFFDLTAQKWEDIRYIVEITVLTKEEFQRRTKKKGKQGAFYNKKVADKATFGGFPTWLKDQVRSDTAVGQASQQVYDWVTVYEVYDFTGDGQYYHVLDDQEEPLFEGELPYRHMRNPFSIMTFNDNMTDLGGVSDVKLISSIQERLNEIDTLELWHAHSSNPVLMVNTGLVDNPEQIITALRDATQPGSMIQLMGKANAPLRDLIGQTPVPTLTPSFQIMRERCTQIIEFILGIPAYSRGVVGVADVATEVALADTSTRTRNGRRIKSTEDAVSSLGSKTISLYTEFLPEGSLLPLRITGSREVLEATRNTLALDKKRPNSEGLMDYDYDAVPFSPTENHRLVQLQKIQNYLPILLEAQQVDKEKLITKLLDLLQMNDILATNQPATQAVPNMEGLPAQEQTSDNIATGALPIGVEPPMPPAPGGGQGQNGIPNMGGAPLPIQGR
mgnify:FL=1